MMTRLHSFNFIVTYTISVSCATSIDKYQVPTLPWPHCPHTRNRSDQIEHGAAESTHRARTQRRIYLIYTIRLISVCVCVCVCVCLHKNPTFPNYSRHISLAACDSGNKQKSGMWMKNGALLYCLLVLILQRYTKFCKYGLYNRIFSFIQVSQVKSSMVQYSNLLCHSERSEESRKVYWQSPCAGSFALLRMTNNG